MKKIIFISVLAVIIFSCSFNNGEKPPDAETIRLYSQASAVYSYGQFTQVMEILQKENNFLPSLILRAKAEYFSGELERAEKTCRRVISLRPSSFEAGIYLTRILREKGDYSAAAKTVESLLADNPQDIRALRLAAELSSDAGKLDEAMSLLNLAAEFSAESAMVLLDRARLYWMAGKANEALNDLSRARAMLPWDTPLTHSIMNLEDIIKEVM